MPHTLVGFSRAGDAFHYRWAARRCLRLIYANSDTYKIKIEGSTESSYPGEFVIDLSEYSQEKEDIHHVGYYQLKHSVVLLDTPFSLSDLKDTFEGFASRFIHHRLGTANQVKTTFTILTNRPFSIGFKRNIALIINGSPVDKKFYQTLCNYTNLSSQELIEFCKILSIEDGHGDYNIQKQELRIEISQLLAGAAENSLLDSLYTLVQEKVLPDSDGVIVKEDVLNKFQITSERQLYPAPSRLEDSTKFIKRSQYEILVDKIKKLECPVIISAEGGVGKSVFCAHISKFLSSTSLCVVYDCFGAGSYRNRSETRHRHHDGLVQIANELASHGLCDPFIVFDTNRDETLMKGFLRRLNSAIDALKKVDSEAALFMVIDAGDNAEMAAKEFGQSCFVSELLREKMPQDCKLVLTCRPERIQLLRPKPQVAILELSSFSQEESLKNLKGKFGTATEAEGNEFHRLTSGNPRVQFNVLDSNFDSVSGILVSLGPDSLTVSAQIEKLFESAVSKIKETVSVDYQSSIDRICLGLASLSPHIPIEVLALASKLDVSSIRSFINDFGPSLRTFERTVQFRDEPTETWFRSTFLATIEDYSGYILVLEPLAEINTYVAEVLPQLLLQAKQYQKLIKIAISDELLPKNNPIDERTVRIYRLQFAFKAALKTQNLGDAIKIAIRAGEEVAGNERQINLFWANTDLVGKLQSTEKVQEIALKRLLSSTWRGSENLYAASLLSGINEYQVEAKGFLRSAIKWLQLAEKEEEDKVSDNDIVELVLTFANLEGVVACVDLICKFQRNNALFIILVTVARKLVDAGRFSDIEEFIVGLKFEPYFLIPFVSEMARVGRISKKEQISECLDLIYSSKVTIEKLNNEFNDSVTPAVISFLEVCLYRKLQKERILKILRQFVPLKALQGVERPYSTQRRTNYLKALAMKVIIAGISKADYDFMRPYIFRRTNKKDNNNFELNEFKEIFNGLFPWYIVRLKAFLKEIDDISSASLVAEKASKEARKTRYRSQDPIPKEIAQLFCSILIQQEQIKETELERLFKYYFNQDENITIDVQLEFLRVAYRLPHLEFLKKRIEHTVYKSIQNLNDTEPEEVANKFISLARAVQVSSFEDAKAYFNDAVLYISKFGEELVPRWEAVVSLAKKTVVQGSVDDKLTYRFARCAEMVGNYVAREKYWNRDGAMRVCAKMSPNIALSVISRWRDRDIGVFEQQLETILLELLRGNVISGKVAWSLGRFFSQHYVPDFITLILEKENQQAVRQSLFDDLINLILREGSSESELNKFKEIAQTFNLNWGNQVGNSTQSTNGPIERVIEKETNDTTFGLERENPCYDELFINLSVATYPDYKELLQRFRNFPSSTHIDWSISGLLKQVVSVLAENEIFSFISDVFESDLVSYIDARILLGELQIKWRQKPSFQQRVPIIVFNCGKRYCLELVNRYSLQFFIDDLELNPALSNKLVEGIFEGLANGPELTFAEGFFSFVNMASAVVDGTVAIALTDFAISRFELHMETGFGDGPWSEEVKVNGDINKNIAGMIWSALGSPRTYIRWNAAHVVRKLVDFDQSDIVTSLMGWMELNKVGAFGHHKFPFYNLHARQYLLMALARASVRNSKIFIPFCDALILIATLEDHVLVQKFAAQIIANIEEANPGAISPEFKSKLDIFNKSNFTILEPDSRFRAETPWHKEKKIDEELKFDFSYDFDHYWFRPLGNVFGLGYEQIEDLSAHIIIKEWNCSSKARYSDDPREPIWNSESGDRETWHDHFSYPKTDDLSFYLSYHAMLVSAGRLFKSMPLVRTQVDSKENPWENWLADHYLTAGTNKWLSDFRDQVPLTRPSWIGEVQKENWKSYRPDELFLQAILTKRNGGEWVHVKGAWTERDGHRSEALTVSTALVKRNASFSLLRALNTCPDPYSYKLPSFGDEDDEIHDGIFELTGWISQITSSKGIDELDPYSNGIDYPLFSIEGKVSELLEQKNDNNTIWQTPNGNEAIVCENWASLKIGSDREATQMGMRLSASLAFLKEICQKFESDIIFDIGISRDLKHYRGDSPEYIRPRHKIILFSSDGRFFTF